MTFRDRLSPTWLLSRKRNKAAPPKEPPKALTVEWHPYWKKTIALHFVETSR